MATFCYIPGCLQTWKSHIQVHSSIVRKQRYQLKVLIVLFLGKNLYNLINSCIKMASALERNEVRTLFMLNVIW